jgi:ABC-type sugar transport system ATPase subunit
MSALSVRSLAKRFEAVQALDDVSFDIAEGEFFCVVGPTNAGKSTLLKTIAGLYRPDGGTIHIGGRPVNGLQPKDRRVSLQFQNMALFPTLTGYENIAFPLRTAGLGEAEVETRVREVAGILNVGHILDRHPRTYSGGEQQRIAIGRAIAHRCELLMLDEPLTNLDARIRILLRIEFKNLHRDSGQTMLYVTHDQVEAMSMSDRIAVLHEGRLQQVGAPDEIYHAPANRFVARFVGMPPMNLIGAELTRERDTPVLQGGGFRTAVPGIESLDAFARLPRHLGVGVRPEDIRVSPARGEQTPFQGDVFWIERLGGKSILDVRLGDETIKAVVPFDHPVQSEGSAWFGFVPRPHHLLDLDTDRFFR